MPRIKSAKKRMRQARARTEHNRAGVVTGLWTAGETLGLALGPGLVLAVLAVSGFVSSTPDHRVTQPDSAVTGVLLAFSLLPMLLTLASLPFILRYRLDPMATESARRAAAASPAS